jgi:protein-L-isoaspartate(D-aspartate) O-methyltransferase
MLHFSCAFWFSKTPYRIQDESMTFNTEQLSQARFNMVEQQVRTWDVLSARVLEVLHTLPREEFVREEHRAMAYADVALPVPASLQEKLFKPVIEGRILQSLDLTGDEDVLEIGTGSGYTTACLAKLARHVHSVDTDATLVANATLRLKGLSIFNAKVQHADGLKHFSAPHTFDVIVLGAAVAKVPDQLWKLLNPNGRIFAVRGYSPVMEAVRMKGSLQHHTVSSLFETDLPYLFGSEPNKPKFSL